MIQAVLRGWQTVDDSHYYLAVMADSKVLPPDVSKLEIRNKPGKIVIKKDSPVVDLGKIMIDVVKGTAEEK